MSDLSNKPAIFFVTERLSLYSCLFYTDDEGYPTINKTKREIQPLSELPTTSEIDNFIHDYGIKNIFFAMTGKYWHDSNHYRLKQQLMSYNGEDFWKFQFDIADINARISTQILKTTRLHKDFFACLSLNPRYVYDENPVEPYLLLNDVIVKVTNLSNHLIKEGLFEESYLKQKTIPEFLNAFLGEDLTSELRELLIKYELKK